ncbi:MAG: DUF5076 domain-containing protein [Azospirillaceae bacterium]|nr:DUF5076 domain-containing protein [Azospirillaceae bacterium]
MNERPIPDAALHDPDAVEMLRVWIAGQELHCAMKIGMYQEGGAIPEDGAWGTILAGVARHLAHALETGYGLDAAETLEGIRRRFNAELDKVPPPVTGGFVRRH